MTGRLKRPNNLPQSKLPIVGNIKCGIKGDNKFPTSTDYFIPAGKYAGMFTNEYGAKPSTIQIIFISNDPAEVCNERWEYRDKDGRLFASGDGENFKVWAEAEKKYLDLQLSLYPDLMQNVEKRCQSNKGWEVILTLRFVIPKVKGIAGLWQFSTKGNASSIPNIIGAFDTMQQFEGSIVGIPCDLNVAFAKSQKPGQQSRFPVVNLVPNMSDENIQMIKAGMINPDQKLLG